MFKNISGVILAGGANKRFDGLTKANIVIGGRTIISRIIDTISEIFREIIIVTNAPEEFNEFMKIKVVTDQFLNTGPLGGVHSALKASSKEALFVFAGDMPLLSRKIILDQISSYLENKCDILIPEIGDKIEPLHAIYNVKLLMSMEDYLLHDKKYAIHEYIKDHDVRYMKPENISEAILAFTNVNTPEDIIRVEKILRAL